MTMKSLKLDFKPLIKGFEFFSKKISENEYSGSHRSFYRHKGVEFEDFKRFAPGDDATLIDWKASLRSGRLLVRQYMEMKNLNIFILLDVSNSMLFSSIKKLKCEYAAELAASLSYYFLKSGDSVGLILFTDKIVKYIYPNLGSKHFSNILKILSNPDFYGGNFNLSNAISFVNDFIRQGAVVVIISDFIGLGEKSRKSFGILSKKADVIGIIIRDPQDIKIKNKIGQAVISDPFSDKIMLVDFDKTKADYEKNARERLEEIKTIFKKNKFESIELRTDKPFVDPIVKFFFERSRRW